MDARALATIVTMRQSEATPSAFSRCSSVPVLLGLLLSLLPNGCAIYYATDVSYSLQDGTSCAPRQYFANSCILELDKIAYVTVTASPKDETHTILGIDLTPMESAPSVKWASKELTVIDVDTKSARSYSALSDVPVVDVRGECRRTGNYQCISYVRSQAAITISPRITNAEVRLPPIVSAGRLMAVPSIRYHDGGRFAVPGPRLALD